MGAPCVEPHADIYSILRRLPPEGRWVDLAANNQEHHHRETADKEVRQSQKAHREACHDKHWCYW